jgi:uncharacterized protein YciI
VTVAQEGAESQIYVLILRRRDPERVGEFLQAHARRLAELHQRGVVLYAGPFAEGGGLTIFQTASRAEAERLVAEDPFVVNATHEPELYAWAPWLVPGR